MTRSVLIALFALTFVPVLAFPQDETRFHRINARTPEGLREHRAKGACCMAGTSRNLDRRLRVAGDEDCDALEREYRSRLDFGVDLIETDLPVRVKNLLYDPPKVPAAKSLFLPHSE